MKKADLTIRVEIDMAEFDAAINRAHWMLTHYIEAERLYRKRATWWGRLKSWFCDGDAECDW